MESVKQMLWMRYTSSLWVKATPIASRSQNISHQADFSMIEGVFDKSGKSLRIQCHFEREGKKIY